jgi:hypothetical protein
VLLSQVGEVSCYKSGQEFTYSVEEANRMVGFGNIICGFTWFAEDKCCGGEPTVMIDIKLKDCSENEVKVINECVNAFLENNIGNSIRARSFEGFKLANCLMNLTAGEVAEIWERFWVVEGCWDRGECWGRGKEGFGKGCSFSTVGSGQRRGAITENLEVWDSGAGEIRRFISNIFVCKVNLIRLDILQPVNPMLHTFILDGLDKFLACCCMFHLGWVVSDVTEFVGYIAEMVLLGLEVLQFLTPPSLGEGSGFLHWDMRGYCFLDDSS